MNKQEILMSLKKGANYDLMKHYLKENYNLFTDKEKDKLDLILTGGTYYKNTGKKWTKQNIIDELASLIWEDYGVIIDEYIEYQITKFNKYTKEDLLIIYIMCLQSVQVQKDISISSVDDVVAVRGKMIDTDNVAIIIYLAGDDNRNIATGQYNIRTDYAHITLIRDNNIDFKPLEDKYDDEAEVIINNACEHSGFSYLDTNSQWKKLRIPLQ